ncbi:putative gustatory receptor 59f [Zeugodacus cucurbitae]|uniref:putative gustatory receptor 59f n=1 Tax=Zeugodacus cucurbitae TaxID=28588 RepID=UPI0023D923DB|nr:putative gustatory receptor 59f [Zeugodacus cucurbitae]
MYYNSDEYRNIPQELLRIYKVYRDLQPAGKESAGSAIFCILHKEMLMMIGALSTVISCCFLVDLLRTGPLLIRYILNSSVFSVANVLIAFNITQFWLALRIVYQLYRGFNEIMKQRLKGFSSINSGTGELGSKKLYAYTTDISWYQREYQSSCRDALCGYEILDSIRSIYFDLDHVMTRLNKVFGVTMLLNFVCSLLSLSIQYFAVFKFFDAENFLGDVLIEIYNRVLWVFIHMVRILLILITNNAIIEELHITSREMERAINRFLLKLMVNQSPVQLCGIVELDLLVVCGIVGAVTNYFIFLVQIDLGAITKSEQDTNSTDKSINNVTL